MVMKKQIDLQLLATLAGGILFNYLFWMEKQALNLLVYSIFIVVILLLDKEIPKSKKIILAGVSHILAAILVVINQSDLTIATWYISLAVFIGFAHFSSLKSIIAALIGAFLQIATVPANLLRKMIARSYSDLSLSLLLKPVKYVIIPAIVLILFTLLYSIANPVFAKYLHGLTEFFNILFTNIFNFFFDELSFLRFMHFILGILFATALFIDFKDKALENAEAQYTDKLMRRRKKGSVSIGYEIIAVFGGNLLTRKMALKTEYIIGIISFTALNLLLLLLNSIDVSTLWLDKANGNNLSAELHDGTNALIISIVMAMLVILYFFSGNLNFYSRNKSLRILVYIWIIQNAFLVASVLLRDFYYIEAHGLTYKRIGVMIFLLLCTIGLGTVYLKVARQKTLFYLCRVNGFFWYILLLSLSFVNWDVLIVKYNIAHRDTIKLDLNHLISLSDKTLPLLHKNKLLMEPYLPSSDYASRAIKKLNDTSKLNAATGDKQILAFENDLDYRIKAFKKRYENTSWRSWNYPDWQTYRYLIGQHL